MSQITERHFMTQQEIALKRKLDALLRDDGKGHHHAKYADRLKAFDINIVPLDPNDPDDFTAAISFDEGVIYIGEGFLVDKDLFFQLNVLLRHELAHNLLMHQIRMMHKLGRETSDIFNSSSSLHRLLNIIADDEISNRIYTAEDKETVRNMWLNGHLIGGLVTEDHRKDWVNLSIEAMYDKLTKEIEEVNNNILRKWSLRSNDLITDEITQAYIYTDTDTESIIKSKTIKDWIDHGCLLNGKPIAKHYMDLTQALADDLEKETITDAKISDWAKEIAKSSPIETVTICSVNLLAPEDKMFAQEILKKYKTEYATWFDKVYELFQSSSNLKYDPNILKALYDTLVKEGE